MPKYIPQIGAVFDIKFGEGSWNINSSGTQTITHNLGRIPKLIRITYRAVGHSNYTYNQPHGVGIWSSGGNITVFFGVHESPIGSGLSNTAGTSANMIRIHAEYSVSGTYDYTIANITSVTETTFTLTWNKFGSYSTPGTVYFIWEVIG